MGVREGLSEEVTLSRDPPGRRGPGRGNRSVEPRDYTRLEGHPLGQGGQSRGWALKLEAAWRPG